MLVSVILFFRFFSLIGYYKILRIVPCTIRQALLFIYSSMYLLLTLLSLKVVGSSIAMHNLPIKLEVSSSCSPLSFNSQFLRNSQKNVLFAPAACGTPGTFCKITEFVLLLNLYKHIGLRVTHDCIFSHSVISDSLQPQGL